MTAPRAKKRIIALVCGGIAAVLLLGAVFAVSESGRKVFSHFHRKFQAPRKAEDAVTASERDLERHAQFLERAKQGDIDLLFVGDSLTDRWSRVGEWSWLELAPSKPANFGVEGERTEHLLWRIEDGELDGISPKVVVVLIGTNNVSSFPDEKPEWTASGIERIVMEIRKRSPASKVLLFGIFPRDDKDSRTRRTIAEINREIQPLDDGAHIRFADIGAEFLDANGNIPADIMPDKVHLSAKGYELWYGSLKSILSEMLR